jgi:hypothetical protein
MKTEERTVRLLTSVKTKMNIIRTIEFQRDPTMMMMMPMEMNDYAVGLLFPAPFI